MLQIVILSVAQNLCICLSPRRKEKARSLKFGTARLHSLITYN
jgi:hypothetical protein